MDWLFENWVEISAALTGLVTVASIIVKLTPTPQDDEFLAKIISVLNVLAINPKTKK